MSYRPAYLPDPAVREYPALEWDLPPGWRGTVEATGFPILPFLLRQGNFGHSACGMRGQPDVSVGVHEALC